MSGGCDYVHEPGDPDDRADWFLQGEAGEFYVCDRHFQMRTEEGKRGWVRIADEVDEAHPPS